MNVKMPINASAVVVSLAIMTGVWGSAATGAPARNQNPKATAMRDVIPTPVDRGELNPVLTADGSGLPYELWRGLDAAGIETLIGELQIPPRSPTLHNLWKRLITADGTAPSLACSAQRACGRSCRSGV